MTVSAETRRSLFGVAVVLVSCSVVLEPAPAAGLRNALSLAALDARTPVTRKVSYRLNGKVRPLLFWIGREDVGEAFITWRRNANGDRAFELLIGSDPSRAPRDINRWGFIVEEFGQGEAAVLGVMKESNEQTLQEAEAKVARRDGSSVFKAARTTIAGSRAVTRSMTVTAPAHLTYRDVNQLLALIAGAPANTRSTDIPLGTQPGFLVAMDVLIRASLEPCGSPAGAGAAALAAVPYLYNQSLYDLTLVSCEFQPEFRTKSGALADAVDGRFRLRNRTTKHDTRFRVIYGASGEFRELPLRAAFRPRWWIEVELEIEKVIDLDGRLSTWRFVS